MPDERVTPDLIRQMIAAINVNDPEGAHSTEDGIHTMVLKAIATGECDEPKECARVALTTEALQFSRWCA